MTPEEAALRAIMDRIDAMHAELMGRKPRKARPEPPTPDIEAECKRLGILNMRRRPDGVWQMAQE